MAGIARVGAYIPAYRISGEQFSAVWGTPASGQRAIANHDEDAITMAAAAALECMKGMDPKAIDGLYLASTTFPYAEKLNAATVATVCDLRSSAFTADFTGSLRCGLSALRAALQAVKSGEAKQVLVVVSSSRLAQAGSDMEPNLGDGAAAILVSDNDLIASVDAGHSISEDFMDVWRRNDEPFLAAEDQRFIQTHGYERYVKEALDGLLQTAGIDRSALAGVAFYAPDARMHRAISGSLKLSKEQMPDAEILSKAGDSGPAYPFLSLIRALEKAQAGDKLAVVGYGSGADAFLLTIAEGVSRVAKAQPVSSQLARGRMLSHYGKYLRFRELVQGEKIQPYTSSVLLWREQDADVRLHAKRCRKCESLQYPVGRVCWKCGSKDDFEDAKLASTGTVYTFTRDYLVPTADPPVIMAAADLDGGGRFYGQVTDCPPDDVKIGMRVEFTFRRIHEGGGFFNYFWKFRPVQEDQA